MSNNGSFKEIKALYAVLAKTPGDDEEGIMSGIHSSLGMVPLVFSKLANIEGFKPQIRELVQQHGIKCRIVKFTASEVIETIES